MINVWESGNARAEAEQFCEVWGIDGPVLLDEQAEYARLLGVRGVPTNILVERGVVRAVGPLSFEEIVAAVDALDALA